MRSVDEIALAITNEFGEEIKPPLSWTAANADGITMHNRSWPAGGECIVKAK